MTILTYILAVVSIVQLLALVFLWRHILRIDAERSVEAAQFDQIQQQLSAAQRNIHDLGFLFQHKAAETPRVVEKVQDTAITASPYTQAIELFKRGLGAHDVAERCGISRSEAELILSLYRNSPAS